MIKCMGLLVAGTKNPGRYGEVTVVGRWPLVEV